MKRYRQAFKSLEVGETFIAGIEHLACGVLCLLWALSAPLVAVYGLLRPTHFFLFLRWLRD